MQTNPSENNNSNDLQISFAMNDAQTQGIDDQEIDTEDFDE